MMAVGTSGCVRPVRHVLPDRVAQPTCGKPLRLLLTASLLLPDLLQRSYCLPAAGAKAQKLYLVPLPVSLWTLQQPLVCQGLLL